MPRLHKDKQPGQLSPFQQMELKLAGLDLNNTATAEGLVTLWGRAVCAYCNRSLWAEPVVVTRNIPLSRGLDDGSYHNCSPACRTCSREKGDKTQIEYNHWRAIRAYLREEVIPWFNAPFPWYDDEAGLRWIELAVNNLDGGAWGEPSVFRVMNFLEFVDGRKTTMRLLRRVFDLRGETPVIGRIKVDGQDWLLEFHSGPLLAYYARDVRRGKANRDAPA